jgi:hypothetical protein
MCTDVSPKSGFMIIVDSERHTVGLLAKASGTTETVEISNVSLTNTNYMEQSPYCEACSSSAGQKFSPYKLFDSLPCP